MKDSNINRAKAIIENILYITIATVSEDGTPHNSPVFSAYDKDYNFYWGSHRHAQHSINIRANGNVFLVIYDSTVEAGTGKGVYVKARAKELENPEETAFAHNLLKSRRPVPFWKMKQVQGDAPIRLYKAVSEKFWVNEDGDINGNYIDIREEINLLK